MRIAVFNHINPSRQAMSGELYNEATRTAGPMWQNTAQGVDLAVISHVPGGDYQSMSNAVQRNRSFHGFLRGLGIGTAVFGTLATLSTLAFPPAALAWGTVALIGGLGAAANRHGQMADDARQAALNRSAQAVLSNPAAWQQATYGAPPPNYQPWNAWPPGWRGGY